MQRIMLENENIQADEQGVLRACWLSSITHLTNIE